MCLKLDNMPNFKVFQIPQAIIPNLDEPDPKNYEWEIYDDECRRRTLDNIASDDTIEKVLSLSGTNFISTGKTVHHIKYTLKKNKYDITKHQDSCRFTVIIYLNKDNDVKDRFWVNNNEVKENLWNSDKGKYKAIIFWGNADHHGEILGNGNREILCFFSD